MVLPNIRPAGVWARGLVACSMAGSLESFSILALRSQLPEQLEGGQQPESRISPGSCPQGRDGTKVGSARELGTSAPNLQDSLC